MRLERLIAIVVLLLTQRRVTAPQLAERFNVSVRTIYRDIDAICAAGIPVTTYQGIGGGFEIMETFRVSRQFLTLQEMAVLITSVKGISSILGSEEFLTAADKIAGLVPNERRAELSRRCEEIAIDMLPWGPANRIRTLFQTLHNAVQEQRIIQIDYRDQFGSYTQRYVEPMTLVFKGRGWYLFGFCRTREAYRFFRLSRIFKLTEMEEYFDRKDVSYREYSAIEETTIKIDMVLRFKDGVRENIEEFFDRESIEKDEKDSFILRASFPDSPWVDTFILGYGPQVEVLAPQYLRTRITAAIKKMHSQYQT